MARLFLLVFYATFLCASTPFWLQGKTLTEDPNIVLVMADDQGWGQTSYNGHARLKTPNLDAMAANGLRFNRFYAAAPVCSPTRASVLTGRTNRRTGVETRLCPASSGIYAGPVVKETGICDGALWQVAPEWLAWSRGARAWR